MPILTQELSKAVEGLDGLRGVEVLSGWVWDDDVRKWILKLRLSPRVRHTQYLPNPSMWYVHVDDAYPYGSLVFYPAQIDGVQSTFPHQNFNYRGGHHLWRQGRICLETAYHPLRRLMLEDEDYAPEHRLAWHVKRCRNWLSRAAFNNLAEQGEPFELPDFRTRGEQATYLPRIAFFEDTASFSDWQGKPVSGLVDFTLLPEAKILVARSYREAGSKKPSRQIYTPEVGKVLLDAPPNQTGIFLRLPNVPVLPPWQAPATWDELRDCFDTGGTSFDGLLNPLLKEVGKRGRDVTVLLGFPIPLEVGGTPVLIHWQPFAIPVRAFARCNSRAELLKPYKRQNNSESAPLFWGTAENWAKESLLSRGALPRDVQNRSFLIIGAGALGAPMAELLVRGGANRVGIMDGDSLVAGNLVRHTLDSRDIGRVKAAELERRLNAASVHATVEHRSEYFPSQRPEIDTWVRTFDVIVDATAAETLPRALSAFPWERDHHFFNVSVGFDAKRLYVYQSAGKTFDDRKYWASMNRWMAIEREAALSSELPRDAPGCWHPTFPARADDMWLQASAAVKEIVARVGSTATGGLTVFEQASDAAFTGLRKLNGAD